MGLLDGVLGNVVQGALGGGAGDHPLQSLLAGLAGGQGVAGVSGANSQALLGAALNLLQQHGGVAGIVQKLSDAGLGQHVQSWVGTGANLPVTGDQLHQALGSGVIGQIASQLGISPQQASGSLAQLLPEVISRLTPQGQVPANHADLVSQGLALLQGLKG
jgi:uncharacterized protein YidB (DUF937 family)